MSETKNPTISKLILTIKDVEIALTPDEAKGLRDELLKLFPQPKAVEHHHYPWRPSYWPYWSTTFCGGVLNGSMSGGIAFESRAEPGTTVTMSLIDSIK